MATKAIPVTAAKVAATLADYPAYVKPSVMTGWAALTTAEANSIRFYSDSGLTTELAREVVSADEIHVKVPSLTTTTTIYADYDGIRADYAVTDTYGRNAVWSAYEVVHHNLNSTDSAGKHNVTANGGVTLGGAAGQLGVGTDFDGANDSATHTTTTLGAKVAFTIQCWINPDTVASRSGLVMNDNGASFAGASFGIDISDGVAGQLRLVLSTSSVSGGFNGAFRSTSGLITAGSWQKVTLSRNAANAAFYKNGAIDTTTTSLPSAATNNVANFGFGGYGIGALLYYNGKMDEVRIANFEITANWETTEYNNQSDVTTFWGTVTDAGGGAIIKPNFIGFARL